MTTSKGRKCHFIMCLKEVAYQINYAKESHYSCFWSPKPIEFFFLNTKRIHSSPKDTAPVLPPIPTSSWMHSFPYSGSRCRSSWWKPVASIPMRTVAWDRYGGHCCVDGPFTWLGTHVSPWGESPVHDYPKPMISLSGSFLTSVFLPWLDIWSEHGSIYPL